MAFEYRRDPAVYRCKPGGGRLAPERRAVCARIRVICKSHLISKAAPTQQKDKALKLAAALLCEAFPFAKFNPEEARKGLWPSVALPLRCG
jgi:hypothetical protein